MVRVIAALCLVLLVQAMPAHADVVPHGATILETAHISGTSDRAVVYRAGSIYLAVLSSHKSIVWRRRVGAEPTSLQTPEPGTFLAIVPAKHGARAEALTVVGSTVVSAIAGSDSGTAYGDEGVTTTLNSFVVRERDWKHVGSVRYQLDSQYLWTDGTYKLTSTITVPDYPPQSLPAPSALVTNDAGDIYLIRLEVADTDAARETGLMNRPSLDPDSGMLFVFQSLTTEGFWMKNTEIPLSIAFLQPSGQIVDIQDMAAETTNVHYSPEPYLYAIEVNQGYFAARGIKPGDHIQLNLTAPGAA